MKVSLLNHQALLGDLSTQQYLQVPIPRSQQLYHSILKLRKSNIIMDCLHDML